MRSLIVFQLLLGRAAASTCSDNFSDDPSACLAHKNRLGVATCAYCTTDQKCHEVGSLYNPCSDDCCASAAALSTCAHASVDDINVTACAEIWPNVHAIAPAADLSSASGAPWPELGRTRGTGSAIHFSGGGVRAYSAAVGQVRGLAALGLMDSVEYIVGVSGGAWFTSAYVYDQFGANSSDSARLCPYPATPVDVTDDFLATMPDGCMLGATQCNFYTCMAEETAKATVDPWYSYSNCWIDCVDRCYMKPFGLDGRDSYFSLDAGEVDDIVARNPSLAGETFLLPTVGGDRPYMLLGATLLGPSDMNPFDDAARFFLPFELAPLGAGLPRTQNATFTAASSGEQRVVTVGGLVEPFALGAAAADGARGLSPAGALGLAGNVSVLARSAGLERLSVGAAAGVSSLAIAGTFSQFTAGTSSLVKEQLWPFNFGSDAANPTEMILGDGGIVDNFGIFATLRRRLPRVTVFVNTMASIMPAADWDPYTQPPLSDDYIDEYVAALFGYFTYPVDSASSFCYLNQVFAQEDFPPLVARLQAADASGNGVVVTSNLTTVANDAMGISSGVPVQVTWVYLSLADNWKAQLPESVRADLDAGADGPYAGFPNYSLAETSLTEQQANLLAAMTTWVVEANAAVFQSVIPVRD